MARQRHLKHAPIVEALVDIRVEPPRGFKAESFGSLRGRLEPTYPHCEERRALLATIDPKTHSSPPTLETKGWVQGYFFRNADGTEIAQFRTDGFTFNRVKHYTSGDDVLSKALSAWKEYLTVITPERITRIGLRYINQLALPGTPLELGRFLLEPPAIPPGMPGALRGFTTHFAAYDPGRDVWASLTRALGSTPLQDTGVRLTLDIDVYRSAPDAGPGINAESVEPVLRELRIMKNDIFFGGLTEETVERYE